MRDPERIRRSNRILIALVVLMLLYGIINRMQTGDTSFYLFGYKLFGTEQTTETSPAGAEEAAPGTPAEGGASEDGGK